MAWKQIDFSKEFHPYSREDQLARGPKRKTSKADDKKVYDEVTEEARDPKTGYLICAICGKPGRDDEMDRDHIKTRGAGGKTSTDNLRIVHHACHMESHQSGKRQPAKKNALTDGEHRVSGRSQRSASSRSKTKPAKPEA